jgi:subtilisin-like proprotein convertase family protein
MFKRHQNRVLRGRSSSKRKGKGRSGRLFSRQRFSVERLEDRFMFSSTPWVQQGPAPALNSPNVLVPPSNPVSGAIQVVAAHPTNANVLYVGAVNGGVWRTADATSSSPDWIPLTDSLPSQSITSLSLDPTDPTYRTLVAGTGQRSNIGDGDDEVGLYYTTNGGEAWFQFNQPILQNQIFTGVAARGNVILAASAGAFDENGDPIVSLYRSVDSGANFGRVPEANGLPVGGIFDLVADPSNNHRFYAAVEGAGVFRSDNDGATWTDVTTGTTGDITGADIAVNMRIAVHGDVVYVGVVDDTYQLSGIFRSPDKGANWTDMGTPPVNPAGRVYLSFSLAADPTSPNVVYVGADHIADSPYTADIWRGDYSPTGSQFTSIVDAGGGDTSPHGGSRTLAFDANGNLLDGDSGGIYRRTNPTGSGSWGSEIGNLAVTEVHDVAWDSISHTALVGTQDNGTIQQRTPAGTTTWDVIDGGNGGDVAIDNVTLAASNQAIRYFSGEFLGIDDTHPNGNLQRQVIDANNNVISTTNLDISIVQEPQSITPIVLNTVDPHRLLLGDFSDLYESTNQGDSFTDLGAIDTSGFGFNAVGPIVYGGSRGGVANPDLIYVAVGDIIYKRTTAGGAFVATTPFNQFTFAGFGEPVTDIAVDPNDWHTVFATDFSHVYKSSNAGGTWEDVTGNLTSSISAGTSGISSENFRSIAFVHGALDNSIVVGTRSGVFVAHLSALERWEAVGTGLPDVPVYDLEYNAHDNVLVAGTLGRGVWTLASASGELNPAPAQGVFSLHSLPGATKRIYLDFTGNVTTGTHWNTDANQPSIFTPPFDMDGDVLSFDAEQTTIRNIWEQVSELYRPFNVDVTTEDPGVEGIINSGVDIATGVADDQWGVRIAIGGSTYDWYQPDHGLAVIFSAVGSNSFGAQQDVPAFVFAADFTQFAQFAGFGFDLSRDIALLAAHEAGVTLGLSPDGQNRTYVDITTDQKFDDDAFIAVHDDYYSGFGRTDDFLSFEEQQNLVPNKVNPTPPPFVLPVYTLTNNIYDNFPGFVGNQYWSPHSNWGPIMGNGAATFLQWSKGEYFNADNIQDDLAIISSAQNGFGYRPDDHPDTITAADPLKIDPTTVDSDTVAFKDEGIIGEHPSALVSDVDSFSFTVEGLGEAINLNIDPYVNGAALDILAKLYSSDGTLIATSNPSTEIAAGSSTFFSTYYSTLNAGERIADGGWRVQVDQPTITDPRTGDISGLVSLHPAPLGTWTQVSKLVLPAGTYYVTVEGTGKATTYLDGTDEQWLVSQQDPLAEPRTLSYDSALHPGPLYRLLNDSAKPKTAVGYYEDIPDPNDPTAAPTKKFTLARLPEDHSDYGYSNYGSLGSYTITGTKAKNLIVGVDFDVPGGTEPTNWNLYTGGTWDPTTNLISEAGLPVPYKLSISSTGGSIATSQSFPINDAVVPAHGIDLSDLDGYIAAQNQTLSFQWSNLSPSTVYQIFVFGHTDQAAGAENVVTITGGQWQAQTQTYNFTQVVAQNSLVVNNFAPTTAELSTLPLYVISDSTGKITITVTNSPGKVIGLGGLAISPTKVGSISGEKWNDLGVGPDRVGRRNQILDPGEPGLGGWTIYIDENNDGVLNSITTGGSPDIPALTVASNLPVPQPIPDEDNSGIKSDLNITDVGTVQDINVSIDIQHTFDADLLVELISPTGTHVQLVTNRGSDGDNFHNTLFDDSSTVSISTATAPFTGTFRPETPLSALNGESVTGVWQLWVRDKFLHDTGSLVSWSITMNVKGTPGTTTFLETNTETDVIGNYSFSNLPPGLYSIREYFKPDQIAAGWKQTWAPPPITLRSGGDFTGHNFGNWIPDSQLGSIKGQTYYDVNQDGVKAASEPGLPGWIVYIDENNSGSRDVSATPTVVASTQVPKPIEDLKTTTSQITTSALGSVFNVELTLDITHSFVGDLEAVLTSPSGRQVTLLSHDGGQYNDFHNLTFSDSALRSIDTIGFNDLPYTGTWKPIVPLSTFNGDDLFGIWTLSVTDTEEGDQGVLNSWSLSFGSGELFRVTDANGNYQFDNVGDGAHIVREELKSGWTQISPANTAITDATWLNTRWNVAIDGLDVQNVNFANFNVAPLAGDYNRDLVVDASDYILWRKTLGSHVTNFAGADGDGSGIVEQADLAVWRTNFGRTLAGSGSGSGSATLAPAAGAEIQSVKVSKPAPAATALESSSTDAAPFSVQVASNLSVVTASDSAKSLTIESSELVPAITSLAPMSSNSAIEHDAPVIERLSASESRSDLGLLAWLATSSSDERPQADVPSSSDGDYFASHRNDEPETVDVAFEMLEGNALAYAAI